LPAAAALALVESERDEYWLNAKREVYKSTLELIAQRQVELDRGLLGDRILRGNPNRREIALTIDDGPHPVYTPALLQILAQNGVKATFFVVGEQAERYPELVRAESDAGHAIGNGGQPDPLVGHVHEVEGPVLDIHAAGKAVLSYHHAAFKLSRTRGRAGCCTP